MPEPTSNDFKTVKPKSNSKARYQDKRNKAPKEKSSIRYEKVDGSNGFYTVNTYTHDQLTRVRKYNTHKEIYCDLHYVDGQLHGLCELYQLDEKQVVTQSGYTLKFYYNRLAHRTNYVDSKVVSEFFYDEDENIFKVVYYVNSKSSPNFLEAHEKYDLAFWHTFYRMTGLKNTMAVDPDAVKQEFAGLQKV